MSQLDTFITNLRSLISATLSDYAELPYADVIDQNPDKLKERGFAIDIATATIDDSNVKTSLKIDQNINLILVNARHAKEFDASTRRASEVSLYNDGLAVNLAVSEDNTLSDAVTDFSLLGHEGVILSEDGQFLIHTINFNLVMFERN